MLLLAEAATPDLVSVPLIGWCLSEALSRHADVHMVTHIRNRDSIERQGWREGREFSTIDTERLVSGLYKTVERLGGRDNKGWTLHQLVAPIGCMAFERQVWQRFQPALSAGAYDIVHRLTPMSPTTPSILGPRLQRLGVPLVVGPWNGGIPWPSGFSDRMHREREWLSLLRAGHRLLPGYAATRRCAAAILAGSRFTLSEVRGSPAERAFYLPENSVDPARFHKVRSRRASTPLRGIFLGRLVPYKCADVLLRATADLLRRRQLHLDIIGDGPERDAIRALVAELGVRHSVTLHGQVAHEHVQDILRDGDFLACPSIREFGGGVVLEAMALGVTPIVADYGGQAELVDDASGIRVPFTSEADLLAGFRSAIEGLVRQPAQLDRMGAAARARVEDLFTWDRKAEQIVAIYDWVRGGGAKPQPIPLPGPRPVPRLRAVG